MRNQNSVGATCRQSRCFCERLAEVCGIDPHIVDIGAIVADWKIPTAERSVRAGLVELDNDLGQVSALKQLAGCVVDPIGPRIDQLRVIFHEFHNALRGRARDVEGVLGFLRRIGRQFDISPVLIGEVAVYDFVNQTAEMATRFDLHAVPRWQYGEEFLALLDSLESALPLARSSDLSDEPLARTIFKLSEGLIGEIVAIVSTAAAAAVRSGEERITKSGIEALRYVPVTKRRRAPVRDDLL